MPKGVHANHPRASRQHQWKPGGSIASNGYVKIRVGNKRILDSGASGRRRSA
jgi:hypothetical protein